MKMLIMEKPFENRLFNELVEMYKEKIHKIMIDTNGEVKEIRTSTI